MQGSRAWFRSRSALALGALVGVSSAGLSACDGDLGDGAAPERGNAPAHELAERSASLESTLTIPVTQDTSIRISAPNKNFGNARELDVNRALLKLEPSELAAIQAGDYVLSAQLELTLVDRVARRLQVARPLGAHRVLKPWTESAATWLCAVDANPGNARPDCPSANWSLLGGGSFVESPSGSSTIPASRSGVVTLDVTADVRASVTGTLPNMGWLLKTNSIAVLEVADFASAESATPPRLVVKLRRCNVESCNDGNACTADRCSATAECVNEPLTGAACNDGNACTSGDVCSAGSCSAGSALPEGASCGVGQVCSGSAAQCVAARVVINEVESNGGTPGDWVELYNAGTGRVDLSGYRFKDNDDTHAFYALPAGTSLAPGAFLVLEEAQFGFGLGGADSARLFAPTGDAAVESYSWTSHASVTYGRCPDGNGVLGATTLSTKGSANDCTPRAVDAGSDGSIDGGLDGGTAPFSVVVNEVESNGGTPGDWVELFNTGSSAVDLSGYRFKDNDDTHAFYTLPTGTRVEPGGYLLLEEAQFGFGLGSADSARLFAPTGDAPVESYSWTSHASVTYGRCPNGTGAFAVNTTSTKGAANDCSAPVDGGLDAGSDAGSIPAWPGRSSVSIVDTTETFSGNLSGLTYQPTASGPAILWAVTNSPSRLYRLEYDGTLWLPSTTDGWSLGKTLVYPEGSGGPDSEGVTKAEWDAPEIYVATERDNNANTISRLAILRFDTSAVGSTLVATHEWNVTADLPAVGPNLGLEGIAWIPDSYLVSAGFRDESTGAAYDPALYPDHGNGVFFVGVEASGMIYAYALNHASGSFQRVASISSGQAGSMDLAFDRDRNTLWSYCDDTCGNRSTLLNVSSAAPSLGQFIVRAQFDRPAGLPNINNEGITFAPESECVGGFRTFLWADDADTDGHSLRLGAIPCSPLF